MTASFRRAVGWLLFSSVVPALDLLRLLDCPIPLTFMEPLFLAGLTAAAVGEMAVALSVPSEVQKRVASIPWSLVVWGVAILLGIWWYLQSVDAYDNFLLGFNDFGHFGQRVANTWNGRGFLMETPSLPPFWDHFNPGLALLAPVWGLWPDPQLFMLIQAICLAVSAPIVYAIARQLGATGLEGAMWSIAFLVYPPLSQLNLSYTYGWHPVSLALPLLFLAFLFLLRGQRLASLLVALLACSFREDVVVIMGCLAAAMALQLGWVRWRGEESALSETGVLADKFPIWAWATINLALIVSFVLIYEFSGLRQFQVSRFEKLGDTALEIFASPLLRPGVFLGHGLATGVRLLPSRALDSFGRRVAFSRQVDSAGLRSSGRCADRVGTPAGDEHWVSVYDDAYPDPLPCCHGRPKGRGKWQFELCYRTHVARDGDRIGRLCCGFPVARIVAVVSEHASRCAWEDVCHGRFRQA